MNNYPNLSPEERAGRSRFVDGLIKEGVSLQVVGREGTFIAPPNKGPGLLCVVDDDPRDGPSKGPSAFLTVDALRGEMTACLIEGGVAPPHVLARLREMLLAGARVMWISTQVEHEAAWVEWAEPHEEWSVLVVLTQSEGAA